MSVKANSMACHSTSDPFPCGSCCSVITDRGADTSIICILKISIRTRINMLKEFKLIGRPLKIKFHKVLMLLISLSLEMVRSKSLRSTHLYVTQPFTLHPRGLFGATRNQTWSMMSLLPCSSLIDWPL
jgi:hypothetical protein